MILLTLLSAQVFTHNSNSCHGNSSSPITISRMVMLALYPCGSLDKVKLQHEIIYPCMYSVQQELSHQVCILFMACSHQFAGGAFWLGLTSAFKKQHLALY